MRLLARVVLIGWLLFGMLTVLNAQSSPVISSLGSPVGAVGGTLNIYGSGFGTTPGSVTFNEISASIVYWNDTLVQATIPASATSGPVSLTTANGLSVEGGTFAVMPPPSIASSPVRATAGAQVTITGANFGSTRGSQNGVALQSNNASLPASVVNWTDTQIIATIPNGATTGNLCVSVAAIAACNQLDIGGPEIDFLGANNGSVGSLVSIDGTAFGPTQGTVTFNGIPGSILFWSEFFIDVFVPSGATTGSLVITTVDGFSANAGTFTITAGPPTITALTPLKEGQATL